MTPLDGVHVVTIAVNTPGPVAAARLVGLGATVTKVEPPGGDPLAVVCPAWYDELRARQRVVTLDLKARDGRAELDDLLDGADVLLTSQRPSALARLGLGWDVLHAVRPRLSQVAIVGHSSPNAELAGHDLTYVAAEGLVAPPSLPRTLLADLGGAERAVTATLTVLRERDRTGAGVYAEVALADVATFFGAPLRHGATADGGVLGGGLPTYGVYETADGWIALAALEPRFRERVARELSLDVDDARALAEAFRARSADEWERWAADVDVPLSAVRG